MGKFISQERYDECAAQRLLLVPVENPVWTLNSETGCWSCDFGDYRGWTHDASIGDMNFTYWEVGRKIVNELFGAGRMHVQYGIVPNVTFDDTKRMVEACVAADREKRRLKEEHEAAL